MSDRRDIRDQFTDRVDPSRSDQWTYVRLFRHFCEKGWQSGSAAGALLVGPLLGYRADNVDIGIQGAGKSAALGIAVIGAIGCAKMASENRGEAEGRLYRLYYDRNQNRMDNFCRVGAASGLIYAAVNEKTDPWSMVGHAAAGSFVGLAAHSLTVSREKNEKTQDRVENFARDVKESARHGMDRDR